MAQTSSRTTLPVRLRRRRLPLLAGVLALLSMGLSPVAGAYECSATGAVDENADDNDLFDAVACGPGATVQSSFGLALGDGAASGLVSDVAIGFNATASGSYGLAVGTSSWTDSLRATAVGQAAWARADFAVAIGEGTRSLGEFATAVGAKAYADQANSLVLGAIGGLNGASNDTDVAIGTTQPLAPLHVFRDDTTQELLLLESKEPGGPQDRAMIQLVNNGGIRFQFDNPLLGTAWRFQAATGNQDNFEIAKVGTGEIEFRVDADGNAYAAGLLFENSDRHAKTGVSPVDPDDVLERVTRLPISEWAYRESPESQHIGPMAQDFHAAFGTGTSDRRLATMDVAGVALASIQALNGRLEAQNLELAAANAALDREIAALRQELDDVKQLEAELADLRTIVGQLLPQVARN